VNGLHGVNGSFDMYTFIFFLLLSWCSAFGHDQENFLQAQQLYEAGQWQGAYELYEKIVSKGPGVLLAMGNCKYEEKEYGEALALWLRARLHADKNMCTHIDQQIAHLNEQGITSYTMPLWYRWLSRMAHLSSLFGWQLMVLFIWYSLWLCAVYIRKRRWYFFIPLVKLCMIAAVCVCVRYYERQTRTAVTLRPNVALYAGPDTDYQKHVNLDAITCVEILEEKNKWYKIRSGSNVGWVAGDVLRKI
jgi:hypothetical protein